MFAVGTPEWTVWHLKAIGIPRLIDDLERLERTGFAETKCKLVKSALKKICDKSDAAANSNWRPCVSKELHDFRDIYTKWNDRNEGVDLVDRMHRREQIEKMREIRKKMSRNLKRRHDNRGGDAQPALSGIVANEHDKALASDLYSELKDLATANPETFPILLKAVGTFEGKARSSN